MRDFRRIWQWWSLAPPLALAAFTVGPLTERFLVLLALVACGVGLALKSQRWQLAQLAAGALVAACVCLVAHLLADDFGYRYVWLYSAPELSWYLKVSNLWGGDQGTLLLLAALFGLCALPLCREPGWAGPGALLACAWFAAGALIWDPFMPTAGDALALPPRGINAHLVSPWMALHPPLIFGAYAILLAPFGAALEALLTGRGAWPAVATTWLRVSWLVLSAGLFVGMWWASEDYTFGHFWHWDPVQTSVFLVWCLASAQLHGLGRYRAEGRFSVILPLLTAATGIAALLSMAITRSPALASSHRYVGETSLPLILTGALLLLAAVVAATSLGRLRRRRQAVPALGESTVMLTIVIAGFASAAAIAAWGLLEAYLGSWLGWARPEHLKPFFETLGRWSKPGELAALRAAFAQWEPDRYALNAWLAPLLAVLALAGGHYFLTDVSRRPRWLVTAGVALVAGVTAWQLQPTATWYRGTGMTSASTTAIFPWLDALGVAALYLAIGALGFAVRSQPGRRFWAYTLPLAVLHLGVVMALTGGTAATVFDSYAQKMVTYPDDFGRPIALPDGYRVTVWLEGDALVADGARGADQASGGFRSIARVGWALTAGDRVLEAETGHAVYRDDRPPAAGEQGPVRLMCAILDYRYARYVSGDTEMIHPFIHRSWWRDVQVWLPAIDYDRIASGSDRGAGPGRPPGARRTSTVPIVLKVYPLMSLLWLGLGLTLIGAAARLVAVGLDRVSWRAAPGGSGSGSSRKTPRSD